MSGILNQRLVLAGIAAGTLAFVSYCIYFDKKRRSHPDFKKNLRQSKPLSLRNLHVTTLTLLFINLQRGRAGRMSPKMGLVHSPIWRTTKLSSSFSSEKYNIYKLINPWKSLTVDFHRSKWERNCSLRVKLSLELNISAMQLQFVGSPNSCCRFCSRPSLPKYSVCSWSAYPLLDRCDFRIKKGLLVTLIWLIVYFFQKLMQSAAQSGLGMAEDDVE